MLAEKLGKRFVDLDEEVVKADGPHHPGDLCRRGRGQLPPGKRPKQIARFAKEGRQLLSCGGGVIKRPENIRLVRTRMASSSSWTARWKR